LQAFEDRLPDLSEELEMKALTLSNRNLRSDGNGHHSFPESPFAPFHHEMDQLLDNMFNGFGFTPSRQASALPTVQAQETATDYRVEVDLPGVELKDIDLSFSEGVLTLKAERKPATDAVYSSRWSGRFERVIGVGTDVDESRIGAALKNGVLTITLPKKPERQPRRIEIQ
jgi:HSP20 family protein